MSKWHSKKGGNSKDIQTIRPYGCEAGNHFPPYSPQSPRLEYHPGQIQSNTALRLLLSTDPPIKNNTITFNKIQIFKKLWILSKNI